MTRMFFKRLARLAVLSFSGTVLAQAPEIDAVLTHESVSHRADGVTETFSYQEHLIRSGDTVWLERVLPARKVAAQPGTAGEHGPDLQTLPRWIRRDGADRASLTLVDRPDKFLVAVKTIEFGRLGFSGGWAAESSLIDPATIAGMKPGTTASTQAGARWYEAHRKGRYSRVLWNEALQFPLAIETGSEDGRGSSRTTVEFSDATKARPWTGVDGYLPHEIDDFGD